VRNSDGGSKVVSSSKGKDKFIASGMGNKGSSGGTGPTGSSRTYSKGGSVSTKACFNPMDCKATDWAVGGV
jgi:hypothetical protein